MDEPNVSYSPRVLAATLGVNLVDVRFLCADGAWVTEKHVDDETTISETIHMTLDRARATYALRACHEHAHDYSYTHWVQPYEASSPSREEWLVFKLSYERSRAARQFLKRFPTREAAEMWALHNG